MVYLTLFLTLLFALNVLFLFLKFRESEHMLKQELQTALDKLRNTETRLQNLTNTNPESVLAKQNPETKILPEQTDKEAGKRETELRATFSAFAHDLRTPITIIKSGLALVLENFTKMDQEKIQETLKSTYMASSELAELISNLLSVSRMETGRTSIDKENFDLITLTESVVTQLMPLAHEKKLYLKFEKTAVESPRVLADKVKTQEILNNLLSNAIKYTFQGGVTVTHIQENSHITTVVKDTGVGITPEQKLLLFQKFQQVGVGRTQSSSKSTGLGLYISKQLAKAMGGDVLLFQSEPNMGSEFRFQIPVAVA